MNKKVFSAAGVTGCILILAAISFWISWFLMPDQGTADTNHILEIVKQHRMQVLYSVIVQLCSSVLYLAALFLLTKLSFPQSKVTLTGFILFGIGIMGLCADAFFHLLAYFMTDDTVNIQEDVVRVMYFMQTSGVAFLVPLLLPFFIGSLVLASGLSKQSLISRKSGSLFLIAFLTGIAGAAVMNKFPEYRGPAFTLTVLGMFAAGHALIGFELMNAFKKMPARTVPVI